MRRFEIACEAPCVFLLAARLQAVGAPRLLKREVTDSCEIPQQSVQSGRRGGWGTGEEAMTTAGDNSLTLDRGRVGCFPTHWAGWWVGGVVRGHLRIPWF